MVEKSPEATVIDANVSDADISDATQPSKSPINLSLLVAVAALIVSGVALFLVIRGSDAPGPSERDAIFESIEARLKAIESAPMGSGADLAALQGELDAVKAGVNQIEGNFAASVSALTDELDRVGENLKTEMVAPAAAVATASTDSAAALVQEVLAEINDQLSGMNQRVQSAEATLDNLPSDVSEQIATAIGEVKTSSAAQIETLQASMDAGMAELSSRSNALLAETRTALTSQIDETSASLGDRLATVQSSLEDKVASLTSTLDQTKAATADQLAVVDETMSGLSDEFTAMKEVSVETSTKVLAVNQLRDALASSAPVRPHMTSLKALNPTEDVLLSVLDTVDGIADDRVPTQQILADTIAALSPRLVSESRINSAEGTGGKVLARLGSLVTVERIEDIAAIPGIEGNMARAAARVEEGDYDAALTELLDDTVEMNLNPDTQARFDALLTDLGHRTTYEEQRRLLGDWVTTTLNSARATAAN